MNESDQKEQPGSSGNKEKFNLIKWIKGLGTLAFLFFFLKGLVWLAVFLGLFKFIGC